MFFDRFSTIFFLQTSVRISRFFSTFWVDFSNPGGFFHFFGWENPPILLMKNHVFYSIFRQFFEKLFSVFCSHSLKNSTLGLAATQEVHIRQWYMFIGCCPHIDIWVKLGSEYRYLGKTRVHISILGWNQGPHIDIWVKRGLPKLSYLGSRQSQNTDMSEGVNPPEGA